MAPLKLCVFDFDSTLMDGETIDFLAEAHGSGEKVAAITKKAMEGEIDFFEALSERVALLKGMSEVRAKAVCESLPFMPGAKECIGELKKLGVTVICFSGGFSLATAHGRRELGYHMDFSNTLHAKESILTGLVGGEMMFGHSKGVMLSKLQAVLGVMPDETMAVGDGANDRSMFPYAAKKVAFCAKDALKKEANIVVEQKDLRAILEHI